MSTSPNAPNTSSYSGSRTTGNLPASACRAPKRPSANSRIVADERIPTSAYSGSGSTGNRPASYCFAPERQPSKSRIGTIAEEPDEQQENRSNAANVRDLIEKLKLTP